MGGHSDDTGGLKLVSREAGAPAIDLTSLTLPLRLLDYLPVEIARFRQVLPVREDGGRLFIAAARPEDRDLLDEIGFLTGHKIVAYAAHPEQLRDTIIAAYGAHLRGHKVWHGARAGWRADGSVEGALRKEPVSSPPPVREPFASEPSYRAPPPKVERRSRPCLLIVDDEPAIRHLVREGLAVRGYELLEAAGGLEAFRHIKEREPDLILLDAMLPDVHGFDICRRLKASMRYRHIPIIMITAVYKGWRMAADLKESYGVAATVEKPFDLHHLVRLIEKALDGRAGDDRPNPEVLSSEAQRLFQDALAAYQRDDLEGAATALISAVAIDPLSASLHHQLGLVQARRGQDFAAIQELESAADLEPLRFQTLRNLAVLYQKHAFRRKACEAWERALAQAPDEETRADIRKVLVSLL